MMKKTIIKKPSFKEECSLWYSGIDFVIGIDEVGRGAFAGPIVAAGVVFNPNVKPELLCDINDSKLIKPILRRKCAEIIKQNALFYAIKQVDTPFINKFGIGKANSAVFRKVIKSLLLQFDSNPNYFVLIDGFHRKYLPGGIKKQRGIIKGDQKSYSIAAASILAKVYRDNLMKKMGNKFPVYGFSRNKGYGTFEHREAIKNNGLCDLHRFSFVDSFL